MDLSAKDRITQSFAAQSMMTTLGAELSEVTSGLVRITSPILPGTRQQQGFGHAGLTLSVFLPRRNKQFIKPENKQGRNQRPCGINPDASTPTRPALH